MKRKPENKPFGTIDLYFNGLAIRRQVVLLAMQAIVTGLYANPNRDNLNNTTFDDIAKSAISCADNIIEELEKGEG